MRYILFKEEKPELIKLSNEENNYRFVMLGYDKAKRLEIQSTTLEKLAENYKLLSSRENDSIKAILTRTIIYSEIDVFERVAEPVTSNDFDYFNKLISK